MTTRQPIRHIASIVAVETGIGVPAMRSPSRDRTISRVRFEAMRRAREAGYSLGRIGLYFGGRDHTSVIYAVRRAEVRRQVEAGNED